MEHIVTTSAMQEAGLAAAAAQHNAALTEGSAPLTAGEYLALRVGEVLDSYAHAQRVGVVPPYAFVKRFTDAEYSAARVLAVTDEMVAGYLQRLEEVQEVRLFSETVTGGLAYLEAKGVLAAGRAAEIGAF